MKKPASYSSLLAPPTQHLRTTATATLPPPPAPPHRSLSEPAPVASAVTLNGGVEEEVVATTADATVSPQTKPVERDGESSGELHRVMSRGEMSSSSPDNNRTSRASSAPSRANARSSVPTQPQSDSRKDSSVRVAVRIRPLLPKEIATNEHVCVEREDNTITVSSTEKRFTFDHVFPTAASQHDMYEEALQPLMESFLQGFNVTVIAYGQTGSGKTFTMGNNIAASSVISSRLFLQPKLAVTSTNDDESVRMGAVDSIQDGEGLIPRFLHQLFTRLKETESVGGDQVSVSFLEIYGEEIHDLLQESGRPNQDESSQNLQLRESEKGVWVQGLTEVKIGSRKEALEQMRIGSLRRATGSTEMNEHSSRSHAVYTVKIVRRVNRRESLGGNSASSLKVASGSSMLNGKRGVNGRRLSFDANNNVDGNETSDGGTADATIVSKLTFVDLAGSERLKRTQAEGSRMKEGIQINVGLLALGNVINALGDKKIRGSASVQVHVPYRSSKLTRLLQDALGGNSRTLFIACVSPAEANSNETLNTLQYANRAKNIQNKAVKNIDSQSAELLGLKAFNKLLRRELLKARFIQADGIDPSQIEAIVDSLLKDPAVQAYLKKLEQIAMSSGIEGFGSGGDEKNQTEWSRLSAQLSKLLSDREGDSAILAPSQRCTCAKASAESSEVKKTVESNTEGLEQEPEKVARAISELVDLLPSPTDDCRSTKCEAQLAALTQQCAAADLQVSQLQAMQKDLEAQLAVRDRLAENLRVRVMELEADVKTSKVKEEALLLLDRCQEIWRELGLDAEDQASKIKDINALLLKKCSEELEGLQAAREKLQARVDAAYEKVRKLEEMLSVEEPIDLKQLHSVAGKTLLAQEKHLLAAQNDLEAELCRRFQDRVRGLLKIRDLLESIGVTSLQELRHVSIEECKPDFPQLLQTIKQLDAWKDFEDVTGSSLLSRLTALPELDLSTASLDCDGHFLSLLLKENAKRAAEVEDQLQGIRSLLNQLKFTPDEILGVLRRSVSTDSAYGQLEDDRMNEAMEAIFQSGEHCDVSNKGLSFLSAICRSLVEIYDGRSNAISYLNSTVDEAMVVVKEILGDASTEDTQLLIGGQKQTPDDRSAFGCDRHELVMGKQRLEELGGPVESSLRALLLSMDDEFMAFGIETDVQRISFFLGSDDDENNATRKILERYVLGSSGGESSSSEECRRNSFLSDMDPAYDEFGAIYSAEFGKRKLQRMKDSIHDVNVVQSTVQSAQKRLNSLKKIMKLFNEISEFRKKIGQFEANASQKDRLFGSSLRLLEEEKFRKMAAKRYPSLLAALRKEVEKWMQNEEGEFDLSILGKDLKNLLLDMMNTDTGLMHLDLGVVDSFRSSTRRQSKTALTPTPPNTQPAPSANSNLNASAPARSRSMTVMTSDPSAKKRLAFEH